MYTTTLLIFGLFPLALGENIPLPPFENLGVTYKTSHTSYLVFKIPIAPIMTTAQNALDCLENYQRHHVDATYLGPVKHNILRLIKLINYVLLRTPLGRDNVDYIRESNPMPQQPISDIETLEVRSSGLPTTPPTTTYPPLVRREPNRRGGRRRVGRAVSMIEGLLAVSKMSIELLKAFASTRDTANIAAIKFQLERNTKAIDNIQNRLDTSIANYKIIAETQSALVNLTMANTNKIRVLQIATHTSQVLNNIYNALSKLKIRQLPLELVTPEGLTLAFKELTEYLGTFDLIPMHNDRSLFKQKVDAIYNDRDGLKILIPVVAAATVNKLNIYHVSLPPLQITNATLAKIDLEAPYIAVNDEFEAEGQILTKQQFDDCEQIGDGQFSCPKTNFVFRNLSSTCIYNFFLGDLPEIKRTCSLTFMKESNYVTQHEGNSFTVYSTEPDTLNITCETISQSANHVFENSISFVLSRDCYYASTTHHKFFYSSALYRSHEIVIDPIPTAETVLAPLKLQISPVADYLPSLGSIPIDEFENINTPKIFMRIMTRMIYPYTTALLFLSLLYVICHVICIVKGKISCKKPDRTLPYHEQMRRILQ